jgi:hypothetical protein
MKELAEREGVLMATLYRYFPRQRARSGDYPGPLRSVELHSRATELGCLAIHTEHCGAGASCYDSLIRHQRAVQEAPPLCTQPRRDHPIETPVRRASLKIGYNNSYLSRSFSWIGVGVRVSSHPSSMPELARFPGCRRP